MKCLIVAAGQGTRLRSIAASKPLAEVAGRPLLEHVVDSAAAGGASEFVVVTGYKAEGVEAFARALAQRRGVPIRCVRNPDWAKPNGHSVLAAEPLLEGAFVLLMSDHLFDPDILAALLGADRQGAALTLAVDRRIDDPRIDLDDATKVETSPDGRILAISKTLERWDAVDTGIFLATPALFGALRDSLGAGGSGSLSEGVQALADRGEARVFDVGPRWWLDVDDEAAFAQAQSALASRGG
jgi:choline kinase